jgi:CRP/FNR family cyclic AMP-dependent transcriptional regulator
VIAILEFVQTAKQHELLKRFEPRHLEKLAGLAKEVQFRPNQVIFQQGQKVQFFYLITQGMVVLDSVKGSQRVNVQTLNPGDAMGWSAVSDGDDGAHFEARAVAPVRAFAFDGGQLRAACESDPVFGYVMMRALLSLVCERLDATRMQMNHL